MKALQFSPDKDAGQNRVGLLASVRNATESAVAVTQGVDILDIKEPDNGSLGRPQVETVREILAGVDRATVVSVALGELAAWQADKALEVLGCDKKCKIKYAKVGLSQMSGNLDWRGNWRSVIQQLPGHVEPVAVAYLDWELANSPDVKHILEIGSALGCTAALLDTYSKSAGNFSTYFSLPELISIRRFANELGMPLVLAGSIGIDSLSAVKRIAPQLVGVRGAVCKANNRTAELCPERLAQLKLHLSRISGW